MPTFLSALARIARSLPTAAGATIEPQRAIAGASPGTSLAQARVKLGSPRH